MGTEVLGVLCWSLRTSCIWNGNIRNWSGRFTKKNRAAAIVLPTPYDGNMSVTLYRPVGAVLTLIDGSDGAILGNSSASFSYTLCGERNLRLRIAGKAGQKFRVAVSAP